MGCLFRSSSCFSRTIGTSRRIARLSRSKVHTTASALIPFSLPCKRNRIAPEPPTLFAPQKNSISRKKFNNTFKAQAWGQDVEFSPAKIVASEDVTDEVTKILVDIGGLASGYTTPGQFLQLKVGDSKPAFLAIASPPGSDSGVIELLVKKQGETAEALCDLKEGAEVSASPVMGKGFPVDKIPPEQVNTVFLFATGTGISPVKSLMESGALKAEERKDVTLFYGSRSKALMACADALPKWEAMGFKVVTVFSKEGNGYVQDVFGAEKENLLSDPSSTGVILCGQKEMCEAITEMMTAAGVEKDNILLNF